MVVSKSGTNPSPLEILFYFWDYPKLIVCTKGENTLYEIVKKENFDYLTYPSNEEFPNLDDRHTGISVSGLVPAALTGINIKEIYQGAKEMLERCSPKSDNNPALQLATSIYLLEGKGFNEIFCQIYSTKLQGFLRWIIQLIHEGVCKDRKGPTIYGDLSPETQHHTMQRYFGGKKNALGLFITVKQEDQESKVQVPENLKEIKLRDGKLGNFDQIPYAKLLEFEFQGTIQDAIEQELPVIHLELDQLSPKTVGEFLALFQYVAIYLGYLLEINPFGQPQVEKSKDISFELIKQFKQSKSLN